MAEEIDIGFLEEIKKKYVGKWIAVRGKVVVAFSDTHEELLKKLKEKSIDNVYIMYSPTEEEKEYEFLFLSKWR